MHPTNWSGLGRLLLALGKHNAACGGLIYAGRRSAQTQRWHVARSHARDFAPRTACLNGSRGVLRLAGDDVIHFLQGLVTNDVQPLQSPTSRPVYACILNSQGRFLHDLFLYRVQGEAPVILADVDKQGLPELLKLLNRYKLRAQVDITDVTGDHNIQVRFGAPLQSDGVTDGWFTDPRLPDLGLRAILPGPDPSPDDVGVIYAREYRQWRIEHGVAEGQSEIPPGEAVPLEYNLDGLQAISYSKGCYVGQELIARAHYRGMVRKRLMPFALSPPAGVDIGTPVFVADSGDGKPTHTKSVGTMRAQNLGSGRGLAVLRLKEGLAASRGETVLRAKDATTGPMLSPWRPEWWPESWGRENDEQAQAA